MEKAFYAECTLKGISPRGGESGQYWVAERADQRESPGKDVEARRDDSLQSLVDNAKNFNMFPKSNGSDWRINLFDCNMENRLWRE